ncbi:MAG: BamA/TamA family outer membrane protein [Planctomycetota bacterium]
MTAPLSQAAAALLAWLALALSIAAFGACSVLDPTYQATRANGGRGAAVKVRFEGNRGLGEARLRREIEDYLLDLSREPDRGGTVFDMAADLGDLFRASGYPDVEVGYEVQPLEPAADAARVDVTFRISEGPLVVVDPVAVHGNDRIPDSELLALWRSQAAGILGIGKPLFVVAQLEQLAEEITRYYRGRGYLDVEVEGPLIQRDPGAALAEARFRVTEGALFTVAAAIVDEEIRAALGTSGPPAPTGAFEPAVARDWVLELRAQLRRLGYPDPELRLETEINPHQKAAVLRVYGQPGRRARIGEIAIVGNTTTRPSVIHKKLGIRVGEPYDGLAEEEGLRRLYLSGLFTKVRVDREWLDDRTLKLVIVVEETATRELELLGGYGSYERFRGGMRLSERNVAGTGVQVSLLGRVSQRGHRSGISVTEPDLFGTATEMTVGGEFFQREEPSFRDEALGTTLSFARRILSGQTARVGYTFRDHADAQAEIVDPRSRFVDYTEGRLFLDLHNDRRDNPLFPKSGHEQFVLFEMVDESIGADINLLRLRAGGSVHFPLLERLRLVLRAEGGWLWPGKGGSSQVPLQERFFNGGESQVRSFRESQLGPRDASGNPVGGEYRNLLGAELRTVLWRTLEGAMFVDVGNVGSSVHEFGWSNLRYGVGAGLRLVLPIGPIRVDGAWNPDRQPGDKEWVVHFSVGYPF